MRDAENEFISDHKLIFSPSIPLISNLENVFEGKIGTHRPLVVCHIVTVDLAKIMVLIITPQDGAVCAL